MKSNAVKFLGQPCAQCQDNLFERIQHGIFDFPEEEWGKISCEAKDLISHLLVKNARERYTAQQVLNHPWIACGAPETPLQTANNLFRNDSARDIHQMNQHFAMNHFTARLSARVEETIPSVASTPEEESTVAKVFDPESTIVEATKRLEEHVKKEPDAQITTYYNQPPPQMINMNGMMIFAPPMAPPFMPPMQFINPPAYYPQPIFAMPPQFYSSNLNPQQQQQSHGGQMRRSRNNAQRSQRSLTPGYYQQTHNGQGGPQRKGSLRTAMSQLGLENCQNAMIRQVSSGKELHRGQNREAQVNV
jgi:serine/threonine protein kinase